MMHTSVPERYRAAGHITIFDNATGKKILDTYNTIVLSGRVLIGEAIFSATDPQIELSKFSIFFESNTTKLTTADMTYSDITPISDNLTMTETDSSGNSVTNPTYDSTTNSYTFTVTISADLDYFKVNAMGLRYNTGTSDSPSYTLFSRAIFNPRYLRNSDSYTVHYQFLF